MCLRTRGSVSSRRHLLIGTCGCRPQAALQACLGPTASSAVTAVTGLRATAPLVTAAAAWDGRGLAATKVRAC